MAVAGSLTFTALTAGSSHTCGIDTTGKAWCWGYDAYGQIGDGNDDQADEYAPVAVAGNLTFTQLTAGFVPHVRDRHHRHSLVLGLRRHGQVGDGNDCQADKYAPVAVASSLTFTHLTAGAYHTCGIDTTGTAWCWGHDATGRSATATTARPTSTPRSPWPDNHTFTHLTAGDYHTCGIDTTGTAWCWGDDVQGRSATATTARPTSTPPSPWRAATPSPT